MSDFHPDGSEIITYDADIAKAAGTVLKVLAGSVPEGFAPMAVHPIEGHVAIANVKTPERTRGPQRPMTFAQIQQCFDVTLSTVDSNYNAAELIAFVRKVEKFHGIG
jgi:hypothetical protein